MNNFYGQYQAVMPNQNSPMPKTGNWLSAEKYALLQKGLSQFRLAVTDEEVARGQCNHYNINGSPALVMDPDGSGGCTCSICGTHFTSRDFTEDDVKSATTQILDILNTVKIMYLSLDQNAALEYFQIIPFIEKIPQLYNIAIADFKKYEGVNNYTTMQNVNPFGVFNMMTNPTMGSYVQMQQQMANPQGMYGQPAPVYGQPMAPAYNPLYANAPTPGYQPQTQGFAMNPMGGAAPMAYGFNTNMPNANAPVAPAPQAAPAAPAPVAPAPQAAAPEAPVTVDTVFKK